jgi:hypothetical protein
MKNIRRTTMVVVAILAGLAFLTSVGEAGESKAGISSKDEDAFILYKYALLDAKTNRSAEITESTEGNKATYKYDGHALSCKTVMTGFISRTVLDSRTHVVGDFEVSNNSYGITRLSFDFYDEGRRTRTGTMTVDDKVIDIMHFDHQ